jgi:MATE family multidrug resistance protein
MFCHFTAYWIIGLPLGAWLCFRRGWGAFGLWAGLSLALILIGIVLLFAWRRKVRQLGTSAQAQTLSVNRTERQI